MARLTRGVGVGWSIKSQLVRPRLFDHWFDLDQSYQTGRSLVENCSQSPPGPEKFVISKHVITLCGKLDGKTVTISWRDPPPKVSIFWWRIPARIQFQTIPYLTFSFTSLWPRRSIVQWSNAGCERHRIVHKTIIVLSLISFCLLGEKLLLRLSLHNWVGVGQVWTG